MHYRNAFALPLVTVIVLVCTACDAGQLKIGQSAPDFKKLQGVDGKEHGLGDFKEAKLVAVVFTCNHCPVAQAYEDRLIAIQKDYEAKAVQVIAINVNNLPEDRLDEMKKRAEKKRFNFPYLYDATQKTGHDFGATVTPHVFLLDANRNVVYIGAVDDNMRAEKMKSPHLRNAIDAVLDGKKPPKEITKQFGCSIKYE